MQQILRFPIDRSFLADFNQLTGLFFLLAFFPFEIFRHIEVAGACEPYLVMFGQEHTDQSLGRGLVGKDTDNPSLRLNENLQVIGYLAGNKVRIPCGVYNIRNEKWLNKAICEGQILVDLTGCYSNFSILNQLEEAVKSFMTS